MRPIFEKLTTIHPVVAVAGVGAVSYLAAGLFMGGTSAAASAPGKQQVQSSATGTKASIFGSLPATIPAQIPPSLFGPSTVAASHISGGGVGSGAASGGASGSGNTPYKDRRNFGRPPAEAYPDAPRREGARPSVAPAPQRPQMQPAGPAYAQRQAPPQQSAPPMIFMPRFPAYGGGHFGGGGGGGRRR